MRRLTAAALALSICTFLSPGVSLAAGAAASQQVPTGEILARLQEAATSQPSMFQAELVDANGKVVSTQPTTDGTFNFNNVPPGNYTVRVFIPQLNEKMFRIEAGSAMVSVAAGATSNVTVGITAAAAAAAAAAGGTSAAAGAGGSPGLFGMGAAGTVLAGAAAAGVITAVALARNNDDSSPSR